MSTVRELYSSPLQSRRGDHKTNDSPYAVSDGCYVIGTNTGTGIQTTATSTTSTHQEGDDFDFVRWKTQLNDEVSRVVSTENGDVIAVSTEGQFLSLLQGNTGRDLVTRSIRPKAHEVDSTLIDHGITFVKNSTNSIVNDVLIIPYLIEERQMMNMEGEGGGLEEDKNHNKYSLKILLVSGINDGFNAECVKREALKMMKTSTITIDLPKQIHQVSCLNACFLDEKVIRFIVTDDGSLSSTSNDNGTGTNNGTNNGHISLFDYDVGAHESIPHEGGLTVSMIDNDTSINPIASTNSADNEKWSFDMNTGVQIDCKECGSIFMILTAKSNLGRLRICWVDFFSLEMKCQYEMQRSCNNSKVYCIHPLHSPEHSVVAAIAIQKPTTVKSDNAKSEILLVQCGLIKEMEKINDLELTDTDNETPLVVSRAKTTIVNPHIVFIIPISTSEKIQIPTDSTQMAGLISMNKDTYSFSYRVEYERFISYWEFQSGEHKLVGQIKSLLCIGKLDEAEQILTESSHDQLNGKYGSTHNSEVALWRFKHIMLTNEKILSRDKKDQVLEIFRLLATAAVSGGENGLQSLMKASEALRHWPRQKNRNYESGGPKIRDFRVVMSAMSMNMKNVMKYVSPHHYKIVEREIKSLDAKVNCLKCIEAILEVGKEEVPLGFRLSDVNSIEQLFKLLISNGSFPTAELVRQYDAGKMIGPKQMASSVVCIPTDINPRSYCSWLEEIVFPSLIFHQEMLDPIKKWCCKTADFFDQETSYGIDGSTLLLETVSKVIATISVDNHLSFTSHFSTGRRKRKEKMVADSNIVVIKLFQARLLKEARKIGLSQAEVQLKSFVTKGGAAFIAKDLIRISCESSSVEQFSLSPVKIDVENFCERSDICFDNAVAQYAEDLCDNSQKSYNLKESSALARLCSNPDMKCQIALKVLRSAQLSNEKADNLREFAAEAIEWAQQHSIKSELQEVSRLLVIDDMVRRYCGNKAAELFRVYDTLHSSRLLNHVIRFIDRPSQLEDVLFLCDSFTHLSKVDACVSILERVALAPETTEVEGEVSSEARSKQCEHIICTLAKMDVKLAKSVAIKLCIFCSEMTNQVCNKLDNHYRQDENKRVYEACCSAVVAIGTTIAQQLTTSAYYHQCNCVEFQRLQSFSKDFERLRYLYLNFGVGLSLADLRRGHRNHDFAVSIITSFLDAWMIAIKQEVDSDLKLFLERARRGVSMLCGNDSSKIEAVWCKALASIASSLIENGNEDACLKMLEASGILNEIRNESAYIAIISSVIALCSKGSADTELESEDLSSSSMRRVLIAGSLLQEHVLMLCSENLLPSVVFLNNATDIITQVILRADCGVGETMDAFKCELHEKSQSHKPLSLLRKQFDSSDAPKSTARLHPTWYIGDGLLLPPTEAMIHCMRLFKELMIQSSLLVEETNPAYINGLYEFLHSRGAYSISSRMLTCAFTVTLTSTTHALKDHIISAQTDISHDVICRLAERSLGSSGSGNTSGNIDMELAVCHLLSLPIKVAFKAYSRCLPSAMSALDFGRLVTLANVGLRAAGVKSIYEQLPPKGVYFWKKQSTFVSQCQSVFAKAYWWKILKYFHVAFDPNCFEEPKNQEHDIKNKSKLDSKRNIVSILPKLISQASKLIDHPHSITLLATDFARTFNLDSKLAVQRHIEFLLAWPGKQLTIKSGTDSDFRKEDVKDLRRNLVKCEEYVKNLLDFLPSRTVRSSVLRRCIISLEQVEESGRDFERYFFILSLYHNELRDIMEETSSKGQDLMFIEEINRIDRRLDALAVMSSFFEGKPYNDRPTFQKCFIPLTETNHVGSCGVLGNRMVQEVDIGTLFDPLLPLCDCLKNQSSTSALAPLCASLSLPVGFVHARSLVERLDAHDTQSMNGALPTFQTQVLPIIRRLRDPKDAAELAEWCANHYPSDSSGRLECLKMAHSMAIKASTNAESLHRQSINNSNNLLEVQERHALDTVKRITEAKSVLADEVLVANTLQKHKSQRQGSQINNILSSIIDTVKRMQISDPTPEKFVENLLIQGSLLTAEASLNRMIGLSDDDFLILSLAIHQACKHLEDRYSHIDMLATSRALVRRWLLHGDESMESSTTDSNRLAATRNRDESMLDHSISIDEENTSEFVLDLKKITTGEEIWSDDIGSGDQKEDENVTADEEPSSLKATPFGREKSEYLSARVGLRVAFVLFGGSRDAELKNHARYLLKMVFAKSTLGSDGGLRNISLNTYCDEKIDTNKAESGVSFPNGKALTFAMRYRALRAVSVLCNKDFLQSVIVEGKYFNTEKCTLSQICFGSLLAKEIESMRLSLPHSDLEQLSVMHHPSYARTLWRQFHNFDSSNFKGRYLLLLLELSLRESKMTDVSILKMVLREIMNNELPRTMLLSCECLAGIRNLESLFASDDEIGVIVLRLSKKLATSIIHEITEKCESIQADEVVPTIHRLGKSIRIFLYNGISSDETLGFVKMLCKVGENIENSEVVAAIFDITISISFQLTDAKRAEAVSIVHATKKGKAALIGRVGHLSFDSTSPMDSVGLDCFDKLLMLERDYNNEFASIVHDHQSEEIQL